ncbi:MAG: hypothetical protein U9Q70_00235 [Chloroflexota bacterium]|nr:hypothetical protein [Chloroflexota bacterium]
MQPRKELRIALYCLLLVLLSGCEFWPRNNVTSEPASTVAPVLQLSSPPAEICRDATQLRLQPVVDDEMLIESFQWELRATGTEPVLAAGEWSPRQRELIIPFPSGQPLPPGEYVLHLKWGTAVVAAHKFTILAQGSELTSATLSLTPVGPRVTSLIRSPRVFYLHYEYESACRGAPLWVTVKYGEELVCSRNMTLPEDHGQGVVACYQQNGALFAEGEYQATLTLLGGEERILAFRVGREPVAEPGTEIYRPICESPSVSMGLTPDGKPYRSLERFEWYTQGVYLSTRCHNFPSEMAWEARWYREGEEIRVYAGQYEGPDEGFIWDSITGVEKAPFLSPGYYTATINISDTLPLTVAFRLFPYVPADE